MSTPIAVDSPWTTSLAKTGNTVTWWSTWWFHQQTKFVRFEVTCFQYGRIPSNWVECMDWEQGNFARWKMKSNIHRPVINKEMQMAKPRFVFCVGGVYSRPSGIQKICVHGTHDSFNPESHELNSELLCWTGTGVSNCKCMHSKARFAQTTIGECFCNRLPFLGLCKQSDIQQQPWVDFPATAVFACPRQHSISCVRLEIRPKWTKLFVRNLRKNFSY